MSKDRFALNQIIIYQTCFRIEKLVVIEITDTHIVTQRKSGLKEIYPINNAFLIPQTLNGEPVIAEKRWLLGWKL